MLIQHILMAFLCRCLGFVLQLLKQDSQPWHSSNCQIITAGAGQADWDTGISRPDIETDLPSCKSKAALPGNLQA